MTFPFMPVETSEAAAEAVDPKNARAIRETVFETIKQSPNGLTDEELQAALGLPGNTQRPRRWELARAGRIAKSGTRPTSSGRQASVWVANAFPRAADITPLKATTVVHTRAGLEIDRVRGFVQGRESGQAIILTKGLIIRSGDEIQIR